MWQLDWYLGMFDTNGTFRSRDYFVSPTSSGFRKVYSNIGQNGLTQGEELCLLCDLVRSTFTISFGWLYFYEK